MRAWRKFGASEYTHAAVKTPRTAPMALSTSRCHSPNNRSSAPARTW